MSRYRNRPAYDGSVYVALAYVIAGALGVALWTIAYRAVSAVLS